MIQCAAMRVLILIFLLAFSAVYLSAQSVQKINTNLQKLVETEQSFAKFAEEKGTKQAFLEFLADEGIIFQPTEVNGKQFWKNRPDSTAWLSWAPAWADISSDGSLGYTTGGWSFYPNGKGSEPTAFGEYLTIWKKESGGNFKAILDIGITHEKSENAASGWRSPADAGKGEKQPKLKLNDGVFTNIFSKKQLSQGYFNWFADDVIVLREGKMPFSGKTNAFLGLEKMDKIFPEDGYLNFKTNLSPVYGNMMYSHGVYQLTLKDKTVSRWNFVQVWKFRNGRWQIVADVFNPIPATQK